MRRRHFLFAASAALFAASAASAGDNEKKKGGGASYLQFPVATGTIIRPDGRRGVLTVEGGLDVPDAALHLRAVSLVPRLRDAYSTTLQGFAAGLRPGAAPEIDRLAVLLQADTDRVLGRKGARYLLGSVMVN